MRNRIAVLLAACFFVSSSASAEVRRIVDVRYERDDYSKSKAYKMEVVFLTGQELNDKTRSFRYSSFKNYALIWFDQDEVAVVEFTSPLFVTGQTFTRNDFRSAFDWGMDLKGKQVNSESRRTWYFNAKRYMSWIDPREADAP